MANDYFNHDDQLTPQTQVRPSKLNQIFKAIAAAFDKVPVIGKTVGDVPQYEDGGAGNPVLDHPSHPLVNGLSFGEVLQIGYAQDNTTRTISSNGPADIAGLSITFTPKRADSEILLLAFVNATNNHVSGFDFAQDGAHIGPTQSGNNNSNEDHVTHYEGHARGTNNVISTKSMMLKVPAGDRTTRTYTVRGHASWSGTVETLYVNNRGQGDMPCTSTFLAVELKG